MTHKTRLTSLASLLLLLCGCSSSRSNGPTGTGGAGPGSDGAAGSAGAADVGGPGCTDAPAADVVNVSGTWALLQVETSIVRSSFTNDFHTETISILRLQQTQTGSTVSADATWCDRYAYSPDSTVQTTLPADYASMLSGFTWTGSYAQDATGAWSYQLDPQILVQGAILADPTDKNSLPTDPTDPRLVDLDGDGHPGLTVLLTGLIDGSAYVVQWDQFALAGRPTASDHIVGEVTFDTRENVVDSDPALIKQVVAQPIPDANPCVSFFVLARVADAADCAAINAHRCINK